MPKKAVNKNPDQFKIKPEADAETVKKTRRRAAIPTFKSRPLSALTIFMIENGENGKTWQELFEEFRKDCPHQFQEIANLSNNSTRISYQTCKTCGILVKGAGKPTEKNRLGGNNGEAD